MVVRAGPVLKRLLALLGFVYQQARSETAKEIARGIVSSVGERFVSAQLGTLARSWFISDVIDMGRSARDAARFPGENYLLPEAGLQNIGRLLDLAVRLAIVNPELAETITEGISDDLMQALQHITTEPVERMFTVLFGAENLDSDDLTEAYAWGMIPPEMLAWLLMVSGVSNSAAAAAATKALGEKYSGTYRSVEDTLSMYAAAALSLDFDLVEKLYSEARSALYGLPEAARTAFNDYVSEVNRLYTQALRRATEALALLETSLKVSDPSVVMELQSKALLRLAEAEAYLDSADYLAAYAEDYREALGPVFESQLERAVALAEAAREKLMDALEARFGAAAELLRGVEDELWSEYNAVASVIEKVRGSAPPSGSTATQTGGETISVEGATTWIVNNQG